MRNSPPSESSSNVSIRVGASEPPTKRKTSSIVGTVLRIVGALTVALGIFSVFIWRRHQLRPKDRNFKSELGRRGFGSVIKGSLPDGTVVAVKKMKCSRQDEKQFRAEISSLGNIQHANLVRLRGFCAEGSGRLLVYDYVPKGSLNSILFTGSSKSKREFWYDTLGNHFGAKKSGLKSARFKFVLLSPMACNSNSAGEHNEHVEEGVAEEANMEEMLEGKVEPQTPQVMDRPVDRSDTSRINYSHVSS
ncbi:hypothetical protein SUGI_0257290 [Cryptomeria japonica]|nr:hypothetical protein SUGI_0257290 [Cryptomeria japonica]